MNTTIAKTENQEIIAWRVSDYDCTDGFFEIVFDPTSEGAKQKAAGILGYEVDELEAYRMPEFDHYADLGYVPAADTLIKGYWEACLCCGKEIGLNVQKKKEFKRVVTKGADVWCSQTCKSFYETQNFELPGSD
ncbi:hypothetical protein [Zooshikella sp. RANM57]|uniref:hypothetical protein n=1 Tax=Zooshikella sp. RANM57 TaxID=3425863 RepID=UPI003D6DCE03